MNAEKQFQETPSRVIQQHKGGKEQAVLTDLRQTAAAQAKMIETIQCREEEDEMIQGKFTAQRQSEDEEELIQGKFAVQRQEEDEEELLQGKFGTLQRQPENRTGIPDEVKQRMENSLGADFSAVRVHPDSAKAPDVGALAFTQGSEIHFAPGQFKPETTAGRQLLGHELTHVVQQAEGRVQPTTEIGGMAVNDDLSLEQEADVRGTAAAG